jgi:hypothetical protein
MHQVDNAANRPLLLIDVDGVISLFGFDPARPPDGKFQIVDGIAHFLSASASRHLLELSQAFEPAWCTGWEEKANEYLPFILGLPEAELPCLVFQGRAVFGSAHWKLDAIDEYAGDRPAAWIDDNLDDACRLWAAHREAPTLLIETRSATGMTSEHVDELLAWADGVSAAPAEDPV